MKPFRVMLALVILLSMNGLSAFAQAEIGTSFAYISLFRPIKSDSFAQSDSIPIHIQSRQVYESLLPELMEAQRQGQIVRFEPELSFGMLKMEYASNAIPAGILGTGFEVFNDPASFLEATRGLRSMPSHAEDDLASVIPLLSITPKNSCFTGNDFRVDSYFKAYLKNSAGKLMSVADGYTNSNGSLSSCFGWGDWSRMEPGYKFIFKLYKNDRTTLLRTFSQRIPNLSITSIIKSTRTIKGTAPANKNITVYFWHRNLNNDTWISSTKNLTTPATGTVWNTTFPIGTAMRGGDYADIFYSPTSNFEFYANNDVPYISCGLDQNYSFLYGGAPYKPAWLKVKHGVNYPLTGLFSNTGSFFGYLTNTTGGPVFLKAGDQASGTGVPIYTLPALTAIPNYYGDKVYGKAPANKYLWVYLNIRQDCSGNSCWSYYGKYVRTTSTGTYSADFSSFVNIKTTDTLSVEVDYITPATGNRTFYSNLISP